MRLDQMDTDVFRAFRKKRREEDIDDSTINRNLSILRRMMNLTIREKKLQFAKPYFPMVSEAGKVRKGFVTPEQFDELMSEMPSHLKPYALFLYEDVSRTTAAKDIRWSWVDLKEGIIEIPEEITKTGEPQTLPLSDALINMPRSNSAKMMRCSTRRISARNFSRHALRWDSARSPKWFRPKVTNGKDTKA